MHYPPEACLSWYPLTFIGHQAARHGPNPVKGIMRYLLSRTFTSEIPTIAHMETEAPTNWDLPQVPQDRDQREICVIPALSYSPSEEQTSWGRELPSFPRKIFLIICPIRKGTKTASEMDSSCSWEVTEPRLDDLWSELWRTKFIYWVDYLTWWDLKTFQL